MLKAAYVPPMPPYTYVSHRPGPFSALVQASEIGGLSLRPLPPVRVSDRYYDTVDGDLLRAGFSLRVHEGGGEWAAHLQPVGRKGRLQQVRLEARDAAVGPLRLPESPLRDDVFEVAGDSALRPLFTLRRYLTPRIAHAGASRFGMLSFDVVVFEVPGGRVVSNEVEVHIEGEASVPVALDRVFRDHGLVLASRSSFERAVHHIRRALDEPALVLPDERAALEDAARQGGPSGIAAQIILLDARGFRPDTIASQTGLGMARVRHVRERFREVRLGALDLTPPSVPRRATPDPAPVRQPATFGPSVSSSRPSSGGDGSSHPPDADTLEDFLDLFQTESPDTPHFGADDLDGPAVDPSVVPVLDRPTIPRRRYPVVLGPVAVPSGARRRSSFSEVNLATVERSHPARETEQDAAPSRTSEASPLRLHPETPLLAAAHTVVSHRLAAFDSASTQFLLSRAPSDARYVVVAAHGVRLALESFRAVLPQLSAQHLIVALRPLVADLDAALDYGRAALAADRSAESAPTHLAQRARWALDAASARLRDEEHHHWQERARRLLARVASEASKGLSRSDDAASALEDYVGTPFSAPTPTRLQHILGAQLWGRFESIRALEDDLTAPTAETARRLAVAIGGLQSLLEVVSPLVSSASDDVRQITRALRAAEQATVDARQKAVTAGLLGLRDRESSFEGVVGVWGALTSPSFRERLARVIQVL